MPAGYVIRRLLWMVPTLVGITLVTFLMMDLAPLDRARIDLLERERQGVVGDAEARQLALRRLERHYGLVDPETGEPRSVWGRYLSWLGNAVRLELAGPGEDPGEHRRRLLDALPVTVLVNFWSLVVALVVALFVGARAGMRRGAVFDRTTGGLLFTLYGVPDVVVATVLVLLFGGIYGLEWFPVSGLRSEGAGDWPVWRQLLDLAHHLVLPVVTLAIGPAVVLTRFLRDSVGRAARSGFALNLRAWGLPERHVRRRVLRNGLSPLITLAGVLLPMLVGGSVVVENVFSLPGVGRLAYDAVQHQDQGMVMTLTLLSAALTLIGVLASDLVHRAVDPRVELR